jgi:hypothetical protein
MKATKESVINNMCLTFNHAYCLPAKDENDANPINCALTQQEKDFLWKQMAQIFTNDIEPLMEFKR